MFGMLTLLTTNPSLFLVLAFCLVISLTVHEFAHAFVADRLGDPTARYLGRLTLNPLSHLDPWGTVLLLVAGFGWGRPVPFNPINLKNPLRDGALVAVAGPVSNILLATFVAVLSRATNSVSQLTYALIYYNLVLACFNLIPIHPLDGFKVVQGFLPRDLAYKWANLESYGFFILLFLIVTGSTSLILTPMVSFWLNILGF